LSGRELIPVPYSLAITHAILRAFEGGVAANRHHASAQAAIRCNLDLITASGQVYSFLLTEIRSDGNAGGCGCPRYESISHRCDQARWPYNRHSC
jgi:hypothetical protein